MENWWSGSATTDDHGVLRDVGKTRVSIDWALGALEGEDASPGRVV